MPWTIVPQRTLWNLTDNTLPNIQRSPGSMPTFFMTGDGHRNPPFRWILSCNGLQEHFERLIQQRRLCAHVEEYQEQVELTSVPYVLRQLYIQKRVFGWELDIYRYIQRVGEEYLLGGLGLAQLDDWDDLNHSRRRDLIERLSEIHENICEVDKRLKEIGDPHELKGKKVEHETYLKYYDPNRRWFFQGWTGSKPEKPRKKYSDFLQQYDRAANSLRTSVGVHQAIGRKIMRNMKAHPECTHLITCGNAHIDECTRHLYEFVNLGPAKGVVDADDGRLAPRLSGRRVLRLTGG